MQSRDISQLEAAIQAGEKVLEQGNEALADAQRALQDETAKAAARQQLAAAVQARDGGEAGGGASTVVDVAPEDCDASDGWRRAPRPCAAGDSML